MFANVSPQTSRILRLHGRDVLQITNAWFVGFPPFGLLENLSFRGKHLMSALSDNEPVVRFWPTNIVQNPSFPYSIPPFSLVFNHPPSFRPAPSILADRRRPGRSPSKGPGPLNDPAAPRVPREPFFRKNPFYFGIFVARMYLCRPKNVE